MVAGILLIICHQICIKTDKDLVKCQKMTTVISSLMLVIIVLNILVVSLGGPEQKPIMSQRLTNSTIEVH